MKAGVVTYHLKKEKIADASKAWERLLEETRRTAPGFLGGSFMANEETGQCVGLGFWETSEDSVAFGKSDLYRNFMESLHPDFEFPPLRHQYEVKAVSFQDLDTTPRSQAA